MAPRELAETMGLPMPTTMDEWIAMGTRQKDLESSRTFVSKDGIKSLSITEARTLCCAVPLYQENITWYFSFGGQMLSATPLRWQGEGAERDLDLLRDPQGHPKAAISGHFKTGHFGERESKPEASRKSC
jgi:hypothetical protein